MTLKKTTRNKFEADVEQQLRRARVKYKYEQEKIPYILARHYIPDFILETPHGKIYIECKGYLRPDAKCKMVAVKRQHPEMDVRILFYRRVESQIRWAERHGFKYAIGTIPKEWFK